MNVGCLLERSIEDKQASPESALSETVCKSLLKSFSFHLSANIISFVDDDLLLDCGDSIGYGQVSQSFVN